MFDFSRQPRIYFRVKRFYGPIFFQRNVQVRKILLTISSFKLRSLKFLLEIHLFLANNLFNHCANFEQNYSLKDSMEF